MMTYNTQEGPYGSMYNAWVWNREMWIILEFLETKPADFDQGQ